MGDHRDDCGTDRGLVHGAALEGGDIVKPLGERVLGVLSPATCQAWPDEVIDPWRHR